MRTLYDSITATDIPLNAQMVGGYVNGAYQWSDSDWARFPNAQHVGIAVSAGFNGGQVLDVETGDATADQAPGWVLMRRASGQDPTIYTSYSAWAGVRQAFINAGVAEPHYWIALWDDSPVLLSGAVAKQYIDPPLSGGHYDLSVVADSWPGVDGVLGPGGGSLTGDNLTQAEFDALVAANAQLGSLGYAARLIAALGANYVPDHPELTTSAYVGPEGYASRLIFALGASYVPGHPEQSVSQKIMDIENMIKAIPAAGTDLTPVLDAVSALNATLARIETALKGA